MSSSVSDESTRVDMAGPVDKDDCDDCDDGDDGVDNCPEEFKNT